jgi:hypothetical protein
MISETYTSPKYWDSFSSTLAEELCWATFSGVKTIFTSWYVAFNLKAKVFFLDIF